MESEAAAKELNVSSYEVMTTSSVILDTSIDEAKLIEEFENISFPRDSSEEILKPQNSIKNQSDSFIIIDTAGNECQPKPIRPRQQTAEESLRICGLIRGDLKVAAKYQWGYGKHVCDDGNDSDSSSDSDDDEFNKILHTDQSKKIEDDIVKILDEVEDVAVLDKDYYKLPEFKALPLNCLENCEIEPFGKVFKHCGALVLIKAYPNKPYLNIDTVLFTSEKVPVGRIYELMGLIYDPFYNLLFESAEEAKKFTDETELFYAPSAGKNVTEFLCLETLLQQTKKLKNHEDDEELSDSEDEEVKYYNNLKKQLEEYEQRKREKIQAAEFSTVKKSKQSNKFTSRSKKYSKNRHPSAEQGWLK